MWLSNEDFKVYIARKKFLIEKYGFAKEYRGIRKIVLYVGTNKLHVFEGGLWYTAKMNLNNDLQDEIDYYRY
ncbi:MAG: hypothetical protein FWD58_11040 [Firmicutes bacterium]|nr:hypothetical protein [Bacillota bacterium]